jgi:Fuc2NAc and GlcNAc transferase
MLVAYIFLVYLVPFLRVYVIDHPNSRSCHSQLTPRGGGLAFVFIASFSSLVYFSEARSFTEINSPVFAPLLAFPLALLGFLDDFKGVPSYLRYLCHIGTALMAVFVSPLLAQTIAFWPLLAMILVAITAVINFTNFMDGLDGLVAGCMCVTLAAYAIKNAAPWPIWALVGALLGFLVWNWCPAKVFMGDAGSTFLGAVFAALVLHSSNWLEALALLLLATPLLGDAFICVLRRLIAGQAVFQAHRLHLFQRLHQAGWPHARVSSLYIAATALLAAALLWGGLPCVVIIAVAELLIGCWLDQQVAVPFDVASRS